MHQLFKLSPDETRSLLAMIRSGIFNSLRAVYWPCTNALLASPVFRKIEHAVEETLGKPVYFLFDELFTPTQKDNFEVWHRDTEDDNFPGGCWNVWIPLYSSGETIAPLELLADPSWREFKHVIHFGEPWVAGTEMKPGQILFVNRQGVMEEQLVNEDELDKVVSSSERYVVHLFDSGTFHRGRPTRDFNIRFGMKFSTEPYSRTRNISLDIQLFGWWWRKLERELPTFATLSPRDKHYAVARHIHEHAAPRFNEATIPEKVFYQSLFDAMLRE
jgi:hypothetical protein